MSARRFWFATLSASALLIGAFTAAAQYRERRWARYEHEMQDPVEDPPDAWKETEFVFARLRYRSNYDTFRTRWGIDANKSDRLFMAGLRRLTRIETRSVEEIVDIDSDDIYNWPWLYAVSVGDWNLSPSQAGRLRQYFARGGFLMVDDFHGEREWANFMQGLNQVYPSGRIVELQNDDPIFHTVYDLSERVQISGFQIIRGMPYERGGIVPHWRAAVDEQGRVQVAICFNMDVGDAWEWSDYPPYPEKLAALAYRLGVNYAVYTLTH
jgi:hypothetical protein